MKSRAFVCALLLAVSLQANAKNYSFDYAVDGGNVIGIDRVFDDGENTVIAFYGPLGNERPTVVTAAGRVLPYRVVGRYIVLPGIQRSALIYARGMVAQVVHVRAPAVRPPPAVYGAQVRPSPLDSGHTIATHVPATVPAAPAPLAAAPLRHATVYPAPGTVWKTPAGHTITAVARAPQPRSEPAPAGAADAAASDSAEPTAAVDSSRFIVTDALAPPPPPSWIAEPAASLRLTTEQWAERAGWTVYWRLDNGADYQTLAVRAEGEFLTALRELYAPYLQSEVGKPVRVAAYTRQKILVISE